MGTGGRAGVRMPVLKSELSKVPQVSGRWRLKDKTQGTMINYGRGFGWLRPYLKSKALAFLCFSGEKSHMENDLEHCFPQSGCREVFVKV